MELFLEGVPMREREYIKKCIKKMIEEIFEDANVNIREINVPLDFRAVVNSKHKRKFPQQEYISKNSNTTIAKSFKLDDNYVEIILNKNIYYQNQQKFFSTMYHELIHSKFYRDTKELGFLNINIEDVYESKQDLIKVFSFIIIDEYNAYKETFIKYPEILNSYSHYFKNMDSFILCLECYNYDLFDDAVDYMNKMKSYLCIPLAIIEAVSFKGGLDNKKIFAEYMPCTYIDRLIEELYQLLQMFKNGIPNEEQFESMKEYILQIFNLVNWE